MSATDPTQATGQTHSGCSRIKLRAPPPPLTGSNGQTSWPSRTELGWPDDELTGAGSSRLVDALVAIGSAEAVVERVRMHRQAGADHVCVQLLAPDRALLDLGAYATLAAALFR